MASYYKFQDCGHLGGFAGWSGDHQLIPGLCAECRAKRIGESIDFIRFGLPPASGKSTNHASGQAESGISVLEIRGGRADFTGSISALNMIESRPAFLGKGEIVGWGSDGEPLVKIVSLSRKPLLQEKLYEICA